MIEREYEYEYEYEYDSNDSNDGNSKYLNVQSSLYYMIYLYDTIRSEYLTFSSSIQQPSSPSSINPTNIFKPPPPPPSSSSSSSLTPPPPKPTPTPSTHQTGEGRSQTREKRNAGKSEKITFFSRKHRDEYGRQVSEHKIANSHARSSKPRFIQILVIHFLRAVTPTLIRRINICADGVFIPRVSE